MSIKIINPVHTGHNEAYYKFAWTNESLMSFGWYAGWPLKHVPANYLLWCHYNIRSLHPGLKRWIDARKQYFTYQTFLSR